MHQAAKEGAGGQNDGVCLKSETGMIFNTDDPAAFDDEFFDQGLFQVESFLMLHNGFHGAVVALLVVLGSGRLNRRALFGVEGLVLNGGRIGNAGPSRPPGRRSRAPVAPWPCRRCSDCKAWRPIYQVYGQQQYAAAHARRRQGRLAAGMAGADHNTIILFRIKCHYTCLSKGLIYNRFLLKVKLSCQTDFMI